MFLLLRTARVVSESAAASTICSDSACCPHLPMYPTPPERLILNQRADAWAKKTRADEHLPARELETAAMAVSDATCG
jgi:hypothetical protein